MASVASDEAAAFTLIQGYAFNEMGEETDVDPEVAMVEWGEEDAVIEVGLSLDARSEEVLEKVERAAERLRNEYGVNVVVVPRVEYWGYSQFTIGFSDYPRVRINGYLIAAGDDITEEDVIDAVLAMLGANWNSDAAPDSMMTHSRPHQNAVAIAAGASA